jgi:hypothetical protein
VYPETFNLTVIADRILHRHQQQYRIVWTEIVGDYLESPYVFPLLLTGDHYRDFLLLDLLMVLEYVPLAVRARMPLMHDGARARCSQ